MLKQRDLPILAGAAVAVYFLSLTAWGIGAHFAPDDLQNIYRYWSVSTWELVRANLQVATGFYRPLGALFYLPLYRWFGFNPLPYRLVIFAVVVLNAWLLYCLARRITESREAGAFAVLIGCFHASAIAAFYSTAVVYEDLCCLFTTGAVLYYVRARQESGILMWKQTVIFLLLSAAALNSKEMAVVIAPAVVLWELFNRGERRGHGAALVAIVLLTAAYAYAKAGSQNSFSQFGEAYRPVFTVTRYMETMSVYSGFLFNSTEPLSHTETVLLWVVLAAMAFIMRNRAMIFGVSFAWIAFLPVNFVTAREGFVLYIPMIGLGIYCGALISAMLRFIRPAESRNELGALVFLVVLALLCAAHVPPARTLFGYMESAQRVTWQILQDFREQKLHFRSGENVYFANTPFSDWDIYFMAKLWARDPSVNVAISGPGKPEIRGDIHDNFTQVFRFEGAKLLRVK